MGTMRGIPERPDGLRYHPDFLAGPEHDALLAHVRALPFAEVRMRGQVARRTVCHFGVDYDYDTGTVTPGTPLPAWLAPLRERCAVLLGRPAEHLAEALVTRYPPGATIGWHRDAPAFGDVIGISLGSACLVRFQRGTGAQRRVFELTAQPGSAYVLSGPSRTAWQHHIPPVPAERHSITLRTLRRQVQV
jgi:alkylated DNA repair dioxygenase AlkB